MQNWPKIHDAMQHVDIVLFDQFSNHCLANLVEPLRATNGFLQRQHYRWRFVTLDGAPVQSSSGLQIAPDLPLTGADGTALMLIPSYGIRVMDRSEVVRAVKRAAGGAHLVGGFDTGAWLLARAGLLDGYRATIHWDMLDAFAEAFPDVDTVRARHVIDRDRVTCSGAMAAFDLVTDLIGSAHGAGVALDVAQMFMSRDAVPAMGSIPARRTVNRAVALMQDHIETPLSIPELARRVGCTQKTLQHRMQAALRASPSAIYRRQRLNAARRLVLDSELSVSEIAGRCGYDNASALTRAFRTAFGQSPSAMRRGEDQAGFGAVSPSGDRTGKMRRKAT
ncbi:GlxA family transcriptional regulator [Tateyamaria omphalii]|uniref:AraC family transcriptional regulator n=1 Tax=Tateyamaria omphalii TaxID=299262 RepID=A0A1P8MQS7_9RHOB|nr:GlxA family transcriptional regulator [Tateyamaria omphalii]APX10384.1 AraC family transcriptional regulator [Tateyamaria omphalii]